MIPRERERQSRFLWTKLRHRTGELIYFRCRTVKEYCWPFQLKANCFWWALWTGMEKKIICQINSCIAGTRWCVNLLKQWNHIWYSTCNWNYYLVKLVIIHCHSPRSICLLHWSNRVEGGCGGNHHPCIFQVLDGSTNLCNPSRNVVLFFIITFVGWGNYNGFHLAFPTITAHTQQIRETMWGFFQLLYVSIPIMHSGMKEITTGWIWGATTLTVRYTWAKTPLITWP